MNVTNGPEKISHSETSVGAIVGLTLNEETRLHRAASIVGLTDEKYILRAVRRAIRESEAEEGN